MAIYFSACIVLFWEIKPGLLWWELAAVTTSLQTITVSIEYINYVEP